MKTKNKAAQIQRLQASQKQTRVKKPVLLPAQISVLTLVDARVDSVEIESAFAYTVNSEQSELPQSKQILEEIHAQFDAAQVDQFLEKSQGDLIRAIAVPFGLGTVLRAYDQDGGNVDTVFNVRKEIYATDNARQMYEQRGQYDDVAYHKSEAYIAAGERDAELEKDGQLIDAYTGEKFKPADRHNRQSRRSVDHTVPGKEVHDDQGRVLAGIDGPELSNRNTNLNPTNQTVNSSKGNLPAQKFSKKLEDNRDKRQEEIDRLEAIPNINDPSNDRERKKLIKLKNQDKVDSERLLEADRKARAAMDAEINKTYYTSQEFATNTAMNGAMEGGKLAFRQAFGVMLVEFFAATGTEIRDYLKNGRGDLTLFDDLKIRLEKVAKRVISKWKDALIALKDGFLSGLLSSIITTIINTFLTTLKNVVRMVREGIASLHQSVKVALCPPPGMTRSQACHEASKLAVGGCLLVGGIMLEEFLAKAMTGLPLPGSLTTVVAAVIAGFLVAISTGCAVYALDRLDLFNVVRDKRNVWTSQVLDARIAAENIVAHEMLQLLDAPV